MGLVYLYVEVLRCVALKSAKQDGNCDPSRLPHVARDQAAGRVNFRLSYHVWTKSSRA
jgi:hypothetical protein